MNIEKNIQNFQQWALGIGFSTENMPCEEAIKSIYKSRQAQLFSELIKRIQPLEIVQEARKNFIIESKKHNDDKIPIYNADITRQYDAYVKVEQLKKQQKIVQKNLEQHRSDYQNAIALLEVKNVHLTKEQDKHSKLQALKHIYKLKVHKLDMQISQEVKKAVSLSNIMPVQYARYAEDEFTRKLVQQALAELNEFETNNEDGEVGKTKFWQEMRQIFYQLPNSTIYEHITNLHIKQMHKFNQLLDICNQKVATGKHLNSFEQLLLETKIKFTEYVAQYLHARNQRLAYETDFSMVVGKFGNEIKEQIHCVNLNEEEVHEIIRFFVYQYNFKNMKQSQNKILASQIDALNVSIEESAKELEEHELLLQSVKQTYLNINVCINRILVENRCMKNMKAKLLFPKNTFNSMVKMKNCELEGAQRKTDLNGDSFNMAVENVFSSTKVDFDTTNCLLMRSPPRATNTAELLLFMETNLNNFKLPVNSSLFFCLAAILPATLTNKKLLGSISNMLFLAPQRALDQLQSDLKWLSIISAKRCNMKKQLNLDEIDGKILKERQKTQNAQFSELMDQTEANMEYIEHLMNKNSKIYQFILKNNLKNYLPTNRTYKNYNFNQYEAEYRNYYAITENFI